MSRYPGIHREPGQRHLQSTCYSGQCPNIRANTGAQDTCTHSPPANVQISGHIQGPRIQAPTVHLLLWPMSKYPGKYRGPGYRHTQSTCHCDQRQNILANTGHYDTGTNSLPASLAKVQISRQIQRTRIQALTDHLTLINAQIFNQIQCRSVLA